MASYVFDAKSSQLTVQAFALGMAGIADHRPRFLVQEFSGQAEFSREDLAAGSIQLTAKVASLEIMDDVTQNDRRAINQVMFGEVLHPETFPELAFRSSQVSYSHLGENRYRADIAGTLALEGIENQQSVTAQLILGDGSVRGYGDFRLRQTDYRLKIASVAGGMLQIGNELKFVFFIVARESGARKN
jgi:polyisoprenoid-binding protein YceI